MNSAFSDIGERVEFPAFTGVRVLMMPFYLDDVRASLPARLSDYASIILAIVPEAAEGMGYVTIDEARIRGGEHHRRPGLHVDGWHDDVGNGFWGGGGWGGCGFVTTANAVGCRVYDQVFSGSPKRFGDCEHLRNECESHVDLKPGRAYHMGPLTVHETIPSPTPACRQFLRVSMPSECGWPVSCTPNPRGIVPSKMLPARPVEFTGYRTAP